MTGVALFRCDGAGMLGHLNRCIALAEAMREVGWRPVFRSALDETGRLLLAAAGLEARAAASSTGPEDAALTAEAAAAERASWIVLDGYDFTPAYAEALTGSAKLAVIDDFANWTRYPADVVLNFTVAAASHPYPRGPAHLLLGPEYFLARTSLRRRRKNLARDTNSVARLCIALRSDTDGAKTASVLQAITHRNLHVRPLIPATAPCRARIEAAAAAMGSESRVRIVPYDLSEDLGWADAVLCTGGMVKYEAIFLGAFPLVVSNTGREAGDTAAWLSRGIGADLGLMSDFDTTRIAQAVFQVLRMDPAALRNVTRRGQALFADDPTLGAARALTALVHETTL